MVTGAHGPTVTALVPTFNGEAFVADTLDSLAAQDYSDLRVLVADDASTDATLAVCRAAGAHDARFEVIGRPRRLGWVASANALLDRADADLVFFAPHDDWFAPTYVSRCVAALRADPGAVLAFTDTIRHRPGGPPELVTGGVGDASDRVSRARPYVEQRGDGRYMPYRGLVRAEALKAVRGLPRSRLVGERQADGRLLFNLALHGRFAHVPDVLCEKRIVGTSLGASWDYGLVSQAGRVLSYIPAIRAADLHAAERRALLAAVPRGLARVAGQPVGRLARGVRRGAEGGGRAPVRSASEPGRRWDRGSSGESGSFGPSQRVPPARG